MNDEIRCAIRLRLEQALETIGEANALREHEFWRGVINRSYYAMFYAVLAAETVPSEARMFCETVAAYLKEQ
jgi:uncharacterized protein (UPF0332 family)